MPAKIPQKLPAFSRLREENYPVVPKSSESGEDINIFLKDKPRLNLVLLNLMPTKITTETQIIRLLAGTDFLVNVELLFPKTHSPENVDPSHMEKFYKKFQEIREADFDYDAMIITGAPVEHLPFPKVTYWEELQSIMDWARENISSTLFICWGAQAALFHYYGIEKYPRSEKLFGVYSHRIQGEKNGLLQGFNDEVLAPHSRHTRVRIEDIEQEPEIDILMRSGKAGFHLAADQRRGMIFQTGHFEYDADTLKREYERDLNEGLDISLPENYFPSNDPEKKPPLRWRAHGQLFYNNWLQLCYRRRQIANSKKSSKMDCAGEARLIPQL